MMERPRRASDGRRWARSAALGVGALWLAGCAATAIDPSDRPPAGTAGSSVVAAPKDGPLPDEAALLLLLEDRRIFDVQALRPLLAGPAGTRAALAVSLGRIGAAEGRLMLESLLADPATAVRRAAAFALGELEDPLARPALARAAADADREAGVLAVEALAKISTPLGEVLAALAGLPAPEAVERIAPSLFRFRRPEDESAVVGLARAALAIEAPEARPALRRAGAYGLARDARPASLAALRELVGDADPWIRGWAARGLGAVGGADDLAALRRLLDDAEAGPVIQALRAGQRLVEAGTVGPPGDWRPALIALLRDERPGVAVTAAEAGGSWLLDPALGAALVECVREGGRRAEVAILALAEGGDPRAVDLAGAWAGSPDRVRRLRATEAAAALGEAGRSVLEALEADPWPAVRAAVVQARLEPASGLDAAARRAVAEAALVDPDPIVRAGVLDLAPAVTGLDSAALAAALDRNSRDGAVDARLAAVRAFAAIARDPDSAAGRPARAIERLQAIEREDPDYLVRRAATQALRELGASAQGPGPAAPARELAWYREIAERTRRSRDVDVRTRHGVFRLRLECPAAPRTCLSFLQLATQGYFDGLAFHRVVPDFVVQGGDPRGDGSGGPGYALRDEINRLRYDRGALGMALSGPDTGGSQFFVTLTPQPHLDGGYTVFGRVVEGMEVVDRIEQGDVMERVVVRP